LRFKVMNKLAALMVGLAGDAAGGTASGGLT
jgi:hypothetical protein